MKLRNTILICLLTTNFAIGEIDLIPYKNKWLCSYETLRFDTPDGDIDFGQYALDESGKGYYIRTKPKNEAQFYYVEIPYDVSALEQVHIVPDAHCYYDQFRNAEGNTVRRPSTAKIYWDTAKIKNHPQPERIELVDELPPPEPEPILPEHQSIALDAASESGYESSVSSISWSHTCTGANGLLVVGVGHNDFSDTVDNITYNSDAVTAIRAEKAGISTRSSIHYRLAPDTGGSYTIVVTFTGTITNGGAGATSYTGVAQTGQPDADNGTVAGGTNTGISTTVTTEADNCWVVSAVYTGISGVLTAGQTERWDSDNPVPPPRIKGSDTNAPKTPAGEQVMNWTWSSVYNVASLSAASFAPAEEAPPAGAQVIIINMN